MANGRWQNQKRKFASLCLGTLSLRCCRGLRARWMATKKNLPTVVWPRPKPAPTQLLKILKILKTLKISTSFKIFMLIPLFFVGPAVKAYLENLVSKISNLENKIYKISSGHRAQQTATRILKILNLENLENLENIYFDALFLLWGR